MLASAITETVMSKVQALVSVLVLSAATVAVIWLLARRRSDAKVCVDEQPAEKCDTTETSVAVAPAEEKPEKPEETMVHDGHSPKPLARLRTAARALGAASNLSLAERSNRWQSVAARHGDKMSAMCELVVVVMVGLPARGKSYISGALGRHLALLGLRVRSFNAGELRRVSGQKGASADFFSASNAEGKAMRDQLAMQCTDDMLEWLYSGSERQSSVSILDATNTTAARRRAVLDKCCAKALAVQQAHEGHSSSVPPLRVVFLESICDDPYMLEANYGMKLHNDDYKNAIESDHALEDFRARVRAYEEQYEPLADAELEPSGDGSSVLVGCVRTYNGGRKLEMCCLSNLTTLQIAPLLLCMHLAPRQILLVLEETVEARQLVALVRQVEHADGGRPLDVLCGASKRDVLMAEQLRLFLAGDNAASAAGEQPRTVLTMRNLEPRLEGCRRVGSGSNVHQQESWQEDRDRVAAESSEDLVRRLQQVILFVERLPRSVIVVCPAEEVRSILLAHFLGKVAEGTSTPLGPVVTLTRDHKGFSMSRLLLPSVSF